jgi:hypothetical protein
VDAPRRPLSERRRAHRFSSPAHGVSAARIRGGHPATIVDVATGGACFETDHRLLPGARLAITLVRADGASTHDTRIVRCTVATLGADTISYRAAVQFARPVPWFTASAIVVQELPGAGPAAPGWWRADAAAVLSRVHERAEDDDRWT